MPRSGTIRRAVLTVLIPAGAAACSALPGGGPAAGGGPPSAAAVQAFATICARLQGEEIANQARRYGFLPADPRVRFTLNQPGQPPTQVQAWSRPGPPAVLLWTEGRRLCELGVGGVDVAEVERAFSALAQTYERQGLAVSRVTVQGNAVTGLALQQAYVVGPKALTPGQLRALSLRVNTDPSHAMQVLMTTGPFTPPPPDDAVTY